MITEDYVSFETAKLLKEKGFDEKCRYVYNNKGNKIAYERFMEGESFVDKIDIESVARYDGWNTYLLGDYAYLCPTLQMAMKWLREKYDLHIEITSIKPYGSDGNGHDIPLDGVEYHSNIVQNNKWTDIIKKFKSHSIACYYSYEQACEAAIIYCLENLI